MQRSTPEGWENVCDEKDGFAELVLRRAKRKGRGIARLFAVVVVIICYNR